MLVISDSLEIERMSFVHTPTIDEILDRGASYLRAGLPVHLRGRAGTGKTTLAVMAAQALGRPLVILYGNDDYIAGDLLGERVGYDRRRLYDNYIHTVVKTEEEMRHRWVDSRLAEACKKGWTLIYDEFNRSRSETNNTLLSIFEEHLLDYPTGISRIPVPVHGDFRAILTSNPDEYAGTHPAQDALLDRMITINLDCFDDETEAAIAASRSGLDLEAVRPLVRAIRRLRETGPLGIYPSLRTSINTARVVAATGAPISWRDGSFRALFADVVLGHLSKKQADEARSALNAAGRELLA